MRLPVTPQISTKDGVSNKNARLTNCLKESKKAGDKAVVRPGLVLDAQASGVGHGLVVFNNELVSVYGSTLGLNTEPTSGSIVTTYNLDTELAVTTEGTVDAVAVSSTVFMGIGIAYDIDEEPYLLVFTYDSSTEAFQDLSTAAGPVYGEFLGDMAASSQSVLICATTLSRYTISGGTWATLSPPNTNIVKGITYKDSKFVAVSLDRVSWSTNEGSTWNSYVFPDDSSGYLNTAINKAVYLAGTWYIYRQYQTGLGWQTYCYKTTDFVTFTPLSISGVSTISSVAADSDRIYVVEYPTLYLSTNGEAFSLHADSADKSFVFDTQGIAYASAVEGGIGKVYELSPTDATLAATGLGTSATNRGALLSDETILVMAKGGSSAFYRIDLSDDVATIPALATITGDYYDFAQSPL